MARAGAPSRRARSDEYWITRQNELVDLLWRYDYMIGVRNLIIQRLQEHLTPEERKALAWVREPS
jgi:hypothetical protein